MDTNLYEKRERIQNQQVNTFLKGMNTDTSDMLLGSDQYRYAKNIRIVTNSNSDDGEVRIVEGNKLVEIVDIEGNQITGEIIAANTPVISSPFFVHSACFFSMNFNTVCR